MNEEIYTLVNPKTGSHYDTYEEKFLSDSWDQTGDTKEYLQTLIQNNPEKFEDYIITDNLN
tara:strand:+ start:369 stop:551 length:183 start_codon:yes stop_codon:yes gene_type:complete